VKRELVWMPGYAGKNHLYDLATNKAICGSDAKPKTDKRGWGLNYWQNMDCPRCKSKANELEANEDQT
jgi:hypothetical protein